MKHRAAEFSTHQTHHEKVLGYFLSRLCERDTKLAEDECSKLYSYGDRPMLSVVTVEEYRKEIYRIAAYSHKDDSVLIEVEILNHKGETVRELEKTIPSKDAKPEVFEDRIGMLVDRIFSTG